MKAQTKIVLPVYLKAFSKTAPIALEKGAVQDIEFSGSTYQVLVKDFEASCEHWVFMQLDGKGQIRDAFCSCDDNSESQGCLHLAVAYLALFSETGLPLHVRFSNSLWTALCRLYENRFNATRDQLTVLAPGNYVVYSRTGKTILNLCAHSPDAITALDKIILREKCETEETSLKFSNLSQEEITAWKEGEPAPQLRFDLSFWSDLAKWLLAKQESGELYQFKLRYSKKELPNWIQVNFSDFEAGFFISEANLPLFVESFLTVDFPIKVCRKDDDKIQSIHYDKNAHQLIIEGASKIATSSQEIAEDLGKVDQEIEVGAWKYIPGHGFYARESHELLKHPVIKGREIAFALSEHTRLIASLIQDCHVNAEPVSLSFQLKFDPQWNLHINAYLFEPGDLQGGDSWLIEDWAYLDDDGFYRVENNRFNEEIAIISAARVSDFITHNRSWLNQQEGFNTHIHSVDYQVDYQVSVARRLTFHKNVSDVNSSILQYDFGTWVYLEGSGFYAKAASFFNSFLKPGISIGPEQIPLFIRVNKDELALIPHFFCAVSPISSVGLHIELVGKNQIKVKPHYQLIKDFEGMEPLFFDEFIFIEDKGFYELPASLRLPEKFQDEMELEGEAVTQFLLHELDALKDLIFYADPRLLPPKQCHLVTDQVSLKDEQKKGWYHFRFYYQTENGLIPLSLLKGETNKKARFYFSEFGRFDLKEKRFDWWRSLVKERFDLKANLVSLSTLEFMKVNAYDSVSLLKIDGQSQQSEQLLIQLTELKTPTDPELGGLVSHLRPYQEKGVHWLWFLYTNQLSGLLCDDMGLGKTHQAMALLAGICNYYRLLAEGTRTHFLIVCPTSVIYHWQEKLARFLPGLNVLTFYGTTRDLDHFTEDHHVLLTSYGILRNEKERIGAIAFEVAIFDEIQMAKNQFSLTYAALKNVQAVMKLGLTGTPIENHLRELKSLFDIILPGYMPAEQEFRDHFIKPIEKEQSSGRQLLLNRLVYPFTLRRKKEDVLTDLPDKIEEIAYCDLTPLQAKLYMEVLETRRRHILEELEDDNATVSYLHIFSLLSVLKQICDHPAVYYKTPKDYASYASGKWELFIELLREARESHQKVVVFSQYLAMLDIIEAYLKDHHIGYASLRGSTKDRKEQLMLFNEDPNCEVFVGSLHAAGLGIDLTAGSVVIHYDRWWNAARENQATDRVHRIGQTKGVQVFKLVTKGTFEEKIDAMITRKEKLMEEILPADEHNALKSFSREELIELLEFTV